VQVAQNRHGNHLLATLQPGSQCLWFQAESVYNNCEIAPKPSLTDEVIVESAAVQGLQFAKQIGNRGILDSNLATAEAE
jgi:hypothetical protein